MLGEVDCGRGNEPVVCRAGADVGEGDDEVGRAGHERLQEGVVRAHDARRNVVWDRGRWGWEGTVPAKREGEGEDLDVRGQVLVLENIWAWKAAAARSVDDAVRADDKVAHELLVNRDAEKPASRAESKLIAIAEELDDPVHQWCVRRCQSVECRSSVEAAVDQLYRRLLVVPG